MDGKYSKSQIILHWLVVILIVPQFLFSHKISKALEARFNGYEVLESPLISLHILTGFSIFCLASARFIQRLDNSNHREDNNINYVGKIIKHLNHYTLYFCCLPSQSRAQLDGSEVSKLLQTCMLCLNQFFYC